MSETVGWPVPIAAIGPVAVGTVLWSFDGQWSVTVLVKGTFELRPDGPMSLVPPEPLSPVDRHEHDSPNRSLCIACETAPQLRQPEVVVFGEAWAPPSPSGDSRATRSAVRLSVNQGGRRVIDKTLLVLGDRRRAAVDAAPFERIALGWERCWGGVGNGDNPLGVGLGASSEVLPNFVHPQEPEGRLASLGPVPRTFPARRSLLGPSRRAPREIGNRLEIEPGLDWDYFQCAMPDQRVACLHGDEWLELLGLTEELRLQTRLPGGRALAHNYGPTQPLIPDWIPLRPDLVQIYAHRRRCTVVWRGGFPIASLDVAGQLLLGAGLEPEGAHLRWPTTAADLPAPSLRPSVPSDEPGGHAMSPEPRNRGAMAGETVASDLAAGARRAALPWEARTAQVGAPARGSVVPSADQPAWAATAEITREELERVAGGGQPAFMLAPPDSERPSRGAPVSVPGAPWSGEKLLPVVPPSADGTTMLLSAPPLATAEDQAAIAKALADAEQRARRQEVASERHAAAELERQRAAERAAAAADAEAARIKAEAEALRVAAEQRFAAEQAAARAEQARRAEEEAERRRKAASELRTGMYGAFKRKP